MPTTVWLLDAGEVSDTSLMAAERSLSDAARARMASMIRLARRRQFVLGRALLRLIGARECGFDASAVKIVERVGDAPILETTSGAAPHFSLSHSGPWIACATNASTPIGLDVEMMDASRDVVALSRSTFAPGQHEWLLRQADRVSAFYRLWTTQEAIVKLRSRFDAAGTAMRIHHEHPVDGLAMSIASGPSARDAHVRRLGADDLSTLGATA